MIVGSRERREGVVGGAAFYDPFAAGGVVLCAARYGFSQRRCVHGRSGGGPAVNSQPTRLGGARGGARAVALARRHVCPPRATASSERDSLRHVRQHLVVGAEISCSCEAQTFHSSDQTCCELSLSRISALRSLARVPPTP